MRMLRDSSQKFARVYDRRDESAFIVLAQEREREDHLASLMDALLARLLLDYSLLIAQFYHVSMS